MKYDITINGQFWTTMEYQESQSIGTIITDIRRAADNGELSEFVSSDDILSVSISNVDETDTPTMRTPGAPI